MTSDTLSSPADAHAPDADRAGPAMPENLARLFYIVHTLLGFGRHFAALIERRTARRGFWLFSAVLGTKKRAAMRASLQCGILRAAALESLLLKRAATGRDVAAASPPTRAASDEDANAHPCDESFRDQIAHLTAERAQYDAPVDPCNLATAEAIEAEVLARSIGRNIADICRDLGVVAIMCTSAFWDATTDAIACYQDGAAAECLDDTQPEPALLAQQPDEDSAPEQMDRGTSLYPPPPSGFEFAERRIIPFRRRLTRAGQRDNVSVLHRHAAVPAAATGPPLRGATKLAA